VPHKFDINAIITDSPSTLADRVHNLKDAKITLEFLLKELKAGYKFDDAAAAGKVATVEGAIGTVLAEFQVLTEIYNQLRYNS